MSFGKVIILVDAVRFYIGSNYTVPGTKQDLRETKRSIPNLVKEYEDMAKRKEQQHEQ